MTAALYARLTATLFALTSAGAAILSAQASDSGGSRISMPDSIRLFRMAESKEFPDPNDGTMFRYRRGDGVFADVFLYPGPDFGKNCDLACASALIKREGNAFIGSLPELVRRKYLDTTSNVGDSALVPPLLAQWRIGRHIRYDTRVQGEAYWSEMYLYFQPGLRVKVRATYLPGEAQRRDLAEFSRSLMDAIANGSVAAQTNALGGLVSIATRFGGSPAAHYPTALAVLRSQGYAIAVDSSMAPTRIVTKGLFTPSALTDTEAGHLIESPGVMLVVELHADGDSTRIVATPRSPLLPGWTDTKAVNTLRLLAMTKFMTAFDDSTRAARAATPRTPEHSSDAPAGRRSTSAAAADAPAPPAQCVSIARTQNQPRPSPTSSS